MFQPCLLHGDHFRELATTCGEGLERQLLGGWQWANGVGHGESEARNQPRVQPVGLGTAPFKLTECLDAARIDETDLEPGRAESADELPGIGADRLQHDTADAGLGQPLDHGGDAFGSVGNPESLARGSKADIKKALTDIDAGRERKRLSCHGDQTCMRATGNRRSCDCSIRQGKRRRPSRVTVAEATGNPTSCLYPPPL